MKRILTIIIVAFSLCPTFANGIMPICTVTRAQAEDPIQSVRRQYAQINRSASKYKKVKKDLSGFSTEGGVLVAYFDGSAIMKIVATFYGETGKASEDYYYRDNKLIFVLRTDYRYNKPLSGKVIRTTVNRFYFGNDKLIRWIDENGRQVASDTSEFQVGQKEYLASSTQFTEGARSRKSTIESNQ